MVVRVAALLHFSTFYTFLIYYDPDTLFVHWISVTERVKFSVSFCLSFEFP